MATSHVTRISTTSALLAAVRAAGSVLCNAPDEVGAVSLAGTLEPGATALPILARAESVAREFGCTVRMRLTSDRYEIRFDRASELEE